MIPKKRKLLLVAAGLLYVLFGILAFFDIPGGHDEHHHTFAHNLTHIILGFVLLGTALRWPARTRQRICYVFAGAYALIGMIGATLGKSATLAILPGIVEFHAG